MTSSSVPVPFVVSASSEFSASYPAWGAYDGSSVDTGGVGVWASAQSLPASITIDYGATYLFSKVEITNRNLVDIAQAPNTFDLQSSSGGVIFTTFASYAGQTWTGNEMKTFTFSPIATRYLRINVLTVNGSTLAAVTLINWK